MFFPFPRSDAEIQTKALEEAPEKTVSPDSKCRSTGIMQW